MEYKNYIEYINAIPGATKIPVTGYVTPPQIADAYNIPKGDGLGVKVGIISLGGGWQQSDLTSALTDLNLPNNKPTQVLLDGATGTFNPNFNDPSNASVENALDLYCVATMVPRANIVIYIGINTTNSFNNVISRAVSDGCDIITISWGSDEVTDKLSVPLTAAAEKGITVFASSGDTG
jgi:subtilase family serine protease